MDSNGRTQDASDTINGKRQKTEKLGDKKIKQ
jgi:hypothetical protein